jgi:hypothetical protein
MADAVCMAASTSPGSMNRLPRGVPTLRQGSRLAIRLAPAVCRGRVLYQEERHAKRDQEDSKPRKATSAPRNTNAAVPASNAWSQPWRTQQQWGWQWGASQQWREERREWRTPQSSWGGWR